MNKNDQVLENYAVNAVGDIDGQCRMMISIDAGSTETRTHIWDGNPKAGSIYGISSEYSVVTHDISGLQSQSDTLYDNLEINLSDVTLDKEDKAFENIKIVKCGMFEDLRLPAAKTSSNTGKGLQDTTFVNAIANIGIRSYMTAATVNRGFNILRVHVTLALPNEDISSQKRRDEVKSKLAGIYDFELPRCNYKTEIIIKEEDVVLFDEAQAVLGAWKFQSKGQEMSYDNVLVVDAGGRSVDLSIMLKGRILARGSLTGKFGGQKFIDSIIEKYVNATGYDMPTKSMILDALDTGLLQDGNSVVDICSYINAAKEEIAMDINNDITSLLDANDLRMNQLNLILCTGRLMGDTKQNHSVKVDSLSSYIGKYISKISPNTYVGQLDDPFTLVRGLSLARYAIDRKAGK